MATERLTTVRLCRAVPLDNSYKDTITFSTPEQQLSYFNGKAYLTATELSYQREGLYVRYSADYDSIINCNYIMYQNASFGTKWFYGFITRIEYINDGMSDVYFQIDAYQTFMFDITINGAFVERQHVNNDGIGVNILPEPVDEGIYNYTQVLTTTESAMRKLERVWYLLAVASDWSGGVIPKYYNNIFSGLDLYCFSNNDEGRNALAFEITRHEATKQGSVQWIAAIPELAIDPFTINPETHQIESSSNIGMAGFTVPRPTSQMTSGYVPRNKKLLTYPYSYFTVSNNDGSIREFHYEDFFDTASNIAFTLYSDLSNSPSVRCTPINYQGNQYESFDAGLTINWGTQISWITDTYTQWLQANRLNFATKQVSATIQTVLGLASGTPAGIISAGQTLVGTAMEMDNQNYQARLKANKVHGNQGGDMLDVALSIKRYFVYQVAIRATDAQRIDAFFDRYGYTVNLNAKPNVTGRRSWNYVKCRNIQITGNCPVEHLITIKNMFLNGCTFWHTNLVGDYSQNNDII